MRRDAHRSSRGSRAALGFVITLLFALGTAWGLSRVQYRERPRWDERDFQVLETTPPDARWRERWVVAVNPACPHCRTSLASLAEARALAMPALRLQALIVDAPEPPGPSTLAALPADEVHWDARGLWRRRWGHGVYGEVLCFLPDGRLRRTLPPFPDAHRARRAIVALGLDGSGS